MNSYIENPKTQGSGIICAIPQTGTCPMECPDCFFQSGRSYLEPLEKNLPNMPSVEYAKNKIVRVNDGNDSHNNMSDVIMQTECYKDRFFNTSISDDLADYPAPVVLTLNPGKMTNIVFHMIEPPVNLMFVRYRVNMWNLPIAEEAIKYYSEYNIPIVLTWMAYHNEDSIPKKYRECYQYRKRTKNSYFAIKHDYWKNTMNLFVENKHVYSCGREGVASGCKFCGNCLREYFSTKEKMRLESQKAREK